MCLSLYLHSGWIVGVRVAPGVYGEDPVVIVILTTDLCYPEKDNKGKWRCVKTRVGPAINIFRIPAKNPEQVLSEINVGKAKLYRQNRVGTPIF